MLTTLTACGDSFSVSGDRVTFKSCSENGCISTAVAGADAKTFKVLDGRYATDRYHAYFAARVVDGADPASFRVLTDTYDIYVLGAALQACDAASFRWLKEGWQVDRQCAYRNSTKLPNAHPEAFSVLNFWYAKDDAHVYSGVRGTLLQGADASTFNLAKNGCDVCGRDKNRCYNAGDLTACTFD